MSGWNGAGNSGAGNSGATGPTGPLGLKSYTRAQREALTPASPVLVWQTTDDPDSGTGIWAWDGAAWNRTVWDAEAVAALAGKADTSHTHTVSQISDGGAAGRELVQKATVAEIKTYLGIGGPPPYPPDGDACLVADLDDASGDPAVRFSSPITSASATIVGSTWARAVGGMTYPKGTQCKGNSPLSTQPSNGDSIRISHTAINPGTNGAGITVTTLFAETVYHSGSNPTAWPFPLSLGGDTSYDLRFPNFPDNNGAIHVYHSGGNSTSVNTASSGLMTLLKAPRVLGGRMHLLGLVIAGSICDVYVDGYYMMTLNTYGNAPGNLNLIRLGTGYQLGTWTSGVWRQTRVYARSLSEQEMHALALSYGVVDG